MILYQYSTSFELFKERNQESFRLFNELNHNNLHKVYPHKLLCDKIVKKRCVSSINGDLMYIDPIHLSFSGNELLAELIMNKINLISESTK